MRRFELLRDEDETGISGTGLVAEGMEWPDGHVALRWGQDIHSTVLYANIEDVEKIHGHGGKTRLVWLDPPSGYPGGDVLVPLCPRCFGGPHVDRGCDHCIDCGASGGVVYLPEWAAKGIRRHDEQRLEALKFRSRELEVLRARLVDTPGARPKAGVEPNTSSPPQEPPLWNVWVKHGTHTIQMCIQAANDTEALRKGLIKLPWIPDAP